MTLVLMGTTDVHGRLVNHDYYTGRETDHGLALLKPLIDSVRAVHAGRTMLFDSGDLLQGNPLGMVYARIHGDQPNPIIRAMNLLDYDAAAIGNHEYNYGLEHLRRALDLAEFPFVSANTFRAGTRQHAFTPYVLLPVATPAGDTLHVGVTGNTPPGVHVWDRDNVSGILDFREIVGSVRSAVTEMRARGADIVVVLSHGGLEGTSYDTVTTGLPPENAAAELARQVPEIDVIFLGHTHRELADTVINGVMLTQAKNWASSLAVATLLARRNASGDWSVEQKRGAIVRPKPGVVDRAFIDSLRWEHERTVAHVNARIGAASERMGAREARVRDTPIIDFVNEVQRRAAGADLSSTAAFQIDAALPAGDISVADVAALYPYDNTLKAIRISGAQLRAYIEKAAEYYRGYPADGGTVTNFDVPGYNFDIVAGVDYTLDLSRPVGERVTSLTRDGAPVRDDHSFTLALNNYRQSGGGGYDMIAGAEVVYDRQEDIRELLIAEVRRRGTIRPEDYFVDTWRIVPAAAAEAALAEQTSREARGSMQPSGADAATARKRLRVLATNDFHGNLAPTRSSGGPPVGGAAALATYFDLERAGFAGAPVLLLDGGDVMQGTPVSNLTRGRSTVEYYNAAGYDAAAIGNHEFDWGPAVLRERMAQAQFPWLAANIVVAGSDTTPSWIRGTTILERDGVRIGIVGLITEETPTATMAEYVRGLEFADGAQTLDRVVPALRAQAVDFVIVVAHAGAYCEAAVHACQGEMIDWLERATEKPDLVVAGHTHDVVRTRANGVTIIETGSWARSYGVVDLERISADSVDVWIRGTPVPWTEKVAADSTVAAIVTRAETEVGPQLLQVVAHAAEEIPRGAGENPMGRLIADAQRTITGTQVAIMNAGGVRAPMPGGPVTWGDLYRIQPFGNRLMVLRLTGARLREAMEHAVGGTSPGAHVSGLQVQFDPRRPAGDRVVSMTLSTGERVEPDVVYSVTVNDFLASGTGDGFTALGQALDTRATGIVDLDALIEYVKSQPQPLRAPRDQRIRAVTTAS
ncbi:MAG TPA: 5'-nucleotidase C-terminal domain-containing protein [Longimicrobiales bacterium]|nr:5'-nucleotidase C-terminal domain-containing protein [Longimicrobiales bacterium]